MTAYLLIDRRGRTIKGPLPLHSLIEDWSPYLTFLIGFEEGPRPLTEDEEKMSWELYKERNR